MTTTQKSSTTQSELLHRLRELIVALDQRVPYVNRRGEAAIARDAASLKERALRRIAQLEAEPQTDVARTDP